MLELKPREVNIVGAYYVIHSQNLLASLTGAMDTYVEDSVDTSPLLKEHSDSRDDNSLEHCAGAE